MLQISRVCSPKLPMRSRLMDILWSWNTLGLTGFNGPTGKLRLSTGFSASLILDI